MPGYVYRGGLPFIPPDPKPERPPNPRPEFDPSKCGTPAGYQQHPKFGQERCRACLDAYNVYQQAYRDKKRGGG